MFETFIKILDKYGYKISKIKAIDQFVYSHHWRDGDAVMWDNRCTLHRATTYAW